MTDPFSKTINHIKSITETTSPWAKFAKIATIRNIIKEEISFHIGDGKEIKMDSEFFVNIIIYCLIKIK